jgi:hypothetical protein
MYVLPCKTKVVSDDLVGHEAMTVFDRSAVPLNRRRVLFLHSHKQLSELPFIVVAVDSFQPNDQTQAKTRQDRRVIVGTARHCFEITHLAPFA